MQTIHVLSHVATAGASARRLAWAALVIALASGLTREAQAQQPAWQLHGAVAEGQQFDVVRGPSDRLHLVSTRYYQLNAQGAVVVVENQGDGRQDALDFPPAIAAGNDGSVHLVTRHGGNYTAGHDIRYRRRAPGGVWDLSYLVGAPVTRNYAVGVAWSGGHVYLAHSDGSTNFWGNIRLFREQGGSALPLGNLSGIWRSDQGFRMRGHGGRVHLASGVPDPGLGGRVYYLWGNAGPNLLGQLVGNKVQHSAGAERKGGPDLSLDGNGTVHLSYGAQFAAYYNQYTAAGQRVLPSDALVMSGLGLWQMKYGLSAVAADDTGAIVVMVGLRSNSNDPDSLAENCSLLWSYSTDGGQSFSAPAEIGRTTHGGVGRLRPRLVAIGPKFFLFFKDNQQSGVSLATLEFESATGFSDFQPAGEVTDGSPDCSIRVRNEISGLDVSSADAEYSTNGGADWTSWPATCTGGSGTTALETITSSAVPFLQESSTDNLMRFRIFSTWGEDFVSPVHPVPIAQDTVPEQDAGVDDAGTDDAGFDDDGIGGSNGTDTLTWPDADDEELAGGGLHGACTCQLPPGAKTKLPWSSPILLLSLLLLLAARTRASPAAPGRDH